MTAHNKKREKSPRPHSFRSARRSANHTNAHAEEIDEGLSAPLELPLVPRGPVPLIDTREGFAELLEHLRASGQFAYDSEFIGELTYVPKLCLIQVASRERVALIDPLAGLDLTPFWELICDPSVEKIVHAGQQDVEPVVRHLGREPANLFDTQIAAGFVGLGYPVALSKLVFEMVGAKLGKGLTFTHWDQRPLSAMQLRYAADDVRYLPALRERLRERLDALGHGPWASEESARLCDASQYRFDPDTQYLRVRGAASLQPRNLAVLRELVIWRDTNARAHDVPPRAFLKDEILIDLSRSPVKSVEKLDRVRGLPRPVEQAHGAEIVETTLRALAAPESRMPPARQMDQTPAERFGTDALWAVVQCLCVGRSIDPSLVASRQEVGEIDRSLRNGGIDASSPLFTGWRNQAIGQSLLGLIAGRTKIEMEWKNGAVVATDR